MLVFFSGRGSHCPSAVIFRIKVSITSESNPDLPKVALVDSLDPSRYIYIKKGVFLRWRDAVRYFGSDGHLHFVFVSFMYVLNQTLTLFAHL